MEAQRRSKLILFGVSPEGGSIPEEAILSCEFRKIHKRFCGSGPQVGHSYSRPRDAMWKSTWHRTVHLKNNKVC